MVTAVILSRFAREQLKEIFGYYTAVASRRVARGVIDDILSSLETLGRNPLMGPVEELLKNYAEGYRYLVRGNYKIVYRVVPESIIVESVFDCRQNPVKIKEFK